MHTGRGSMSPRTRSTTAARFVGCAPALARRLQAHPLLMGIAIPCRITNAEAAYGGYVDTVRVLLRRNAPVNVKDATFEGTPLGWALYAWSGGGPHAGDSRYYNVVKLLVAAGATLAQEWLDEDQRGLPMAKKIRDDTA